ncbi:beta-ketoacyl synthase N-terminal-like domain-containing protein, partial [Streptomyces sp. NPDC000395]|uniref:type I polyketide synthase n=1 Tax=Streptomyces sp. NPDC000395 TaxID=3154252 RepID=UPI00336A135B
MTVEVSLLDPDGTVLVRMRDLVIRALPLDGAEPAEDTAPPAVEAPRADGGPASPAGGDGADGDGLRELTERFLTGVLADTTKLDIADIDADAPLERYGIDSLMITRLNAALEDRLDVRLSKTLFFEYQTLAELVEYFLDEHGGRIQELTASAEPVHQESPPAQAPTAGGAGGAVPLGRFLPRERSEPPAAPAPADDEAIAIIGLSGRYPMADDLDAFWRNLEEGRDCVTEIPPERWDHDRFFTPHRNTPGGAYARWGGFLTDVDKFDPLFFPVMPREAELMDPQERLFLQTSWHVLEDAGYRRRDLKDRSVGVFVGVMYGEYQLYGAVDTLRGGLPVTNSSYASIANRVSYLLDLSGPSLALDTMCSSSLTAIHLACESLRRGESELAIAGGVNVSVHPYKYVFLSQGGYLSDDGRCRSFGAGGSGYVPGEGVGAVLLKPRRKAIEDGDHIYGVILGDAVNHGGKTNGYTVPNPKAQERVIATALRRAGVAADTVSYVEAHGTGTSLGDPIEITGLGKVFGPAAGRGEPCAIGSVKSNIGHLESAAGIAGLTKVLLQFKHRRLVPSLHSRETNPNIDFAATPFRVQQESRPWPAPAPAPDGRAVPRRAGLSSFGAGGSNAHLVLEEADGADRPVPAVAAGGQRLAAPLVFVLSARDEERLREYAGLLAGFLDRERVALPDVAYTLRVGREAMAERLAVVTADGGELVRALRRFAGGDAPAEVERGTAPRGGAARGTADAVRAAARAGDLAELARLWCAGADADWDVAADQELGAAPRRIPLPGYPFARERCWVATADELPVLRTGGTGATAGGPGLHPLVDVNVSTLVEQRYVAWRDGGEWYVADH